VRYVALVLILLLAGSAIALHQIYGGGEPYPSLLGDPIYSADKLEVVAEYPEPIGNVAVNRDGRLFFTVHPESRPSGYKLLEWRDGAATPFPNAESQHLFDTVLGVSIDQQDQLWTIDHGTHGLNQPRLLAFDLDSGALVHDHSFSEEIAPLGSFLQDLQVDSTGGTVYIADVSFWRRKPAIVVYDVANRQAHRALESHPSVTPQDWLINTPARSMTFFGGLVSLKPGVDGIAIDKKDEWLIFGAMAHDKLFRIPTGVLRDPYLNEDLRRRSVELVGKKPMSDGLSMDLDGNIYITDVEHGAIMVRGPRGQLETLIQSDAIRWADALSFGPDRWLYIADSAIPEQMLRTKGHIESQAPYYIYRMRARYWGVPGQ